MATPVRALVDLEKASYTEDWTDITVGSGNSALEFERRYSAAAQADGMFGKGWCSPLEARLIHLPEGRIVLLECGDSKPRFFAPAFYNAALLEDVLRAIGDAYAAGHPGAQQPSEILVALRKDWRRRVEIADESGVAVPEPSGLEYAEIGRPQNRIKFDGGNYIQTYGADGSYRRTFDSTGRLLTIRVSAPSSETRLVYDGGTLSKAVSADGASLSLQYDPGGHLLQVSSSSGTEVNYVYANGRLADAQTKYPEHYDYDGTGHLTKITYADSTSKQIGYESATGRVISFKNRKGCIENYTYSYSQSDTRHLISTVVKRCGDRETANKKFDFWYDLGDDGDYYIQRTRVTNGGTYSEFVYAPGGLITSIKQKGDTIRYSYNAQGLMREKVTKTSRFVYEYDKTNRLISAQQSPGNRRVQLTYDAAGKIETLTDKNLKVTIRYAANGKPQLVRVAGRGAILVTYKPDDEIDKVTVKDGSATAVEIAGTFNDLLDVVNQDYPRRED